jgi:hypothetical protein
MADPPGFRMVNIREHPLVAGAPLAVLPSLSRWGPTKFRCVVLWCAVWAVHAVLSSYQPAVLHFYQPAYFIFISLLTLILSSCCNFLY